MGRILEGGWCRIMLQYSIRVDCQSNWVPTCSCSSDGTGMGCGHQDIELVYGAAAAFTAIYVLTKLGQSASTNVGSRV